MVGGNAVRRGDVFLVALDPSIGREIRKPRPCLVVSPDELNISDTTFIVVPMTTGVHTYPFRVACRFAGKHGHVVVDQIRTIDPARLVRRLGRIAPAVEARVLGALQEMFAA